MAKQFFLGIYPSEIKTYVHKNTLYMNIHSGIINNPQMETIQIFLNKMPHISTTEYHSAIEKNKALAGATSQINVKNMALEGKKPGTAKLHSV